MTPLMRLTLDEPEDLILLQKVFDRFQPDIHFDHDKLKTITQTRLVATNDFHKEMKELIWVVVKSSGKELKRSRVETCCFQKVKMHLPDNWPSYFSKTSGCSVWDLDGKHYYDYHLWE